MKPILGKRFVGRVRGWFANSSILRPGKRISAKRSVNGIGRTRIDLDPANRRQAFERLGLEGEQVQIIYRQMIKRHGLRPKQNYEIVKRLNSYAKILSVMLTEMRGEFRGRKLLELGPGAKFTHLELLKEFGADLYTIDPNPGEQVTRLAKNAKSIWRMKKAHSGVKFDAVFSRGVFEPYSVEAYSGLKALDKEKKRVRLWKQLSEKMNPGAPLVISAIIPSYGRVIPEGELERAGFEVIVDSVIPIERTRDLLKIDAGEEHFIIARKKRTN